jgi:hypothetical protein
MKIVPTKQLTHQNIKIHKKNENLIEFNSVQFGNERFYTYSETLELFSPTGSNRTELNMASRDPNFFNILMFFRVRFDHTELCFIAFE